MSKKSELDEAAHQKVYDLIKKVRESKTVKLQPSKFLRTEITALDGTVVPFSPRYYQVQGIFHFLSINRMVLGDGTGLGKCLSGGSVLLTRKGLVELKTLAPVGFDWSSPEGFYSMGRLEEVWTGTKWAPLKNFYWSGRKPSIRITTRNGFQLEGSHVHPIRVRGEHGSQLVQLADLNLGDTVCIDRTLAEYPDEGPVIPFGVTDLSQRVGVKSYCYPTQLTDDLATLLGYVVSEGHTNSNYSTTVTQHKELNPEPHTEIRNLFKSIFGWEGNEGNKNEDTTIAVSSIHIRSYLRACGVGDDLSRTKEIPWCIWLGTQEQVRNFVSAMIEAEGSVADGGVEFSSASEHIARGMQLLLLRLGVVSTLSPKRVKKYDHTYWRIVFFGDDARKFAATIGFRSSRKADDLQAKLSSNSNPNKDLVFHSASVIQALKKVWSRVITKTGHNDNRVGSGFKQYGESIQSSLKYICRGTRNPSYQWLKRVLQLTKEVGLESTPEYQAIQTVVDQNFFYDPIVKIEHSETELMDVEVDDPEHTFWSNGFISHNTCQAIGAMCYLWEKDASYKVIVICPKSAIRQWAAEVERFAHGVTTFVSMGAPKQREKVCRDWAAFQGPSILLTNYHGLVKDWDACMSKEEVPEGAPVGTVTRTSKGLLDELTSNIPNLLTIFDEVTACKNPGTKTAQVCRFLSDKSKRVWGLTATLLKNNLMEGFGIYQVIRPGTFTSKNAFLNSYCEVELQAIKGGGKIPIVRGYKNLDHFRKTIDPYFYGRAKHQVSSELPALTTKEVVCEMSKQEEAKYVEALTGLLEVAGQQKDYRETKALTSLIYLQEVCDSIGLIDDTFEGRSAKESGLVDLLQDDLEDEKVIVYTRYEKMVTRLQAILKAEKIPSVRITGKESDKERKKAQDAFQDPKSKIRVVFITDAGSEAINLQAAGALVFFDAPWSWGTYLQIIGRMIRIGSLHANVYAIHLVAERPGRKGKERETLDHKVLKQLRKKKSIIDQVLGESAQGALRFERGEDMMADLVRSLLEEES